MMNKLITGLGFIVATFLLAQPSYADHHGHGYGDKTAQEAGAPSQAAETEELKPESPTLSEMESADSESVPTADAEVPATPETPAQSKEAGE